MRKLIEFDDQSLEALKLLGGDRMMSLQELADEAFADLLKKHGRPTSLKEALRESARRPRARQAKPRQTKARHASARAH